MNSKHYLIFDLDDTLLDFKRGEHVGLSKLFNNHSTSHIVFDDWLTTFRQVNREVWKQIESGESAKVLLDTRFAQTFQKFEIHADGKLMEQEYRSYLDENYYVIDGAKELLERMRKEGYKIIAGTNGKSSTQRKRLKGTGLDNFFDDVVISDEIGCAKPNIKFFEHLFNRHNTMTANNSLMIGDSLTSDIQGAINAGIKNIWFNPFELENDTAIKPDFEARSLLEIERLILSSELNQ